MLIHRCKRKLNEQYALTDPWSLDFVLTEASSTSKLLSFSCDFAVMSICSFHFVIF
jgi:hypothetical protein